MAPPRGQPLGADVALDDVVRELLKTCVLAFVNAGGELHLVLDGWASFTGAEATEARAILRDLNIAVEDE